MNNETDRTADSSHQNNSLLNEVASAALKKQSTAFIYLPYISLTVVLLILLISLFFPDALYQLKSQNAQLEPKTLNALVIGGVFAILLIEFVLALLTKRRAIKQQKRLIQSNQQLWSLKQAQQRQANTYLDHKDKLQSFISDKLIEIMDYDEKFIHFKGIAAEVRHNGVISYDKIITALNIAIEQQSFLSIYESKQIDDSDEAVDFDYDQLAARKPKNQSSQSLTANSLYEDAIESIRYLWDLLDLSTADNLSLYIANKLIDCEEHYFQLSLDANKSLDSTQKIPISPTYHPQEAVLKALLMFVHDDELRRTLYLAKINHHMYREPINFNNEEFKVSLNPSEELLGNANHLVLLLENLIKNALFFNAKVPRSAGENSVYINLQSSRDAIQLNILNRGPLIDETKQEQLFKLGYSTRKSHQHHGKGLGLYFVNEIVKGYKGEIQVANSISQALNFKLKLNLINGETKEFEFVSRVTRKNTKTELLISTLQEDNWQPEATLSTETFVESITVDYQPTLGATKTGVHAQVADSAQHSKDYLARMTVLPIVANEKTIFIEPSEKRLPQWQLAISPVKNHHKIKFKPLNIDGVEFSVIIPTARSILEHPEPLVE
ncbi:sensor histidine kinase [Aliikangiella sp. IMCC44632]